MTLTIRRKVASGEFEEAARMWNQHVLNLSEQFRAGTVNPAELHEALELSDWIHVTASCARAHLLHQLNANSRALRIAAAYSANPR